MPIIVLFIKKTEKAIAYVPYEGSMRRLQHWTKDKTLIGAGT